MKSSGTIPWIVFRAHLMARIRVIQRESCFPWTSRHRCRWERELYFWWTASLVRIAVLDLLLWRAGGLGRRWVSTIVAVLLCKEGSQSASVASNPLSSSWSRSPCPWMHQSSDQAAILDLASSVPEFPSLWSNTDQRLSEYQRLDVPPGISGILRKSERLFWEKQLYDINCTNQRPAKSLLFNLVVQLGTWK